VLDVARGRHGRDWPAVAPGALRRRRPSLGPVQRSVPGGPAIAVLAVAQFQLVAPLGVSLLLRAFAGDGWQDFGLRPALKANVLWYVVSILIYPVCTAFILAVGTALGAVSLSGFSVGSSLQAVALAIIPGLLTAIEELGWRGYLAPKVYKLKWNAFVAHAVVGIIWGAWHIPYFSVFWSHSMQNVPLRRKKPEIA
jgi:membrane protease YdiL (CAAX protease family)